MITVTGSVEFARVLQPIADKMNSVLGDRLEDIKIVAKPEEDMPTRSDGGVSFGYSKLKLRQIWLWDEIEDYPVGKTAWHEAMHFLDDDWLTRAQRQDIMKLMLPQPKGWNDDVINGKRVKYKGLPSECFAVYASAALGGYAKPAYMRLFLRSIPHANWSTLAGLTLKDYGHAQPEPEVPEPPPTPPDPAQAEIERLTALLAEISQDNTELAAMQLTVANKAKVEAPA